MGAYACGVGSRVAVGKFASSFYEGIRYSSAALRRPSILA